MNKNRLSVAIFLLAVAIVVINLWNPLKDNTERTRVKTIKTEDSTSALAKEGKPAPDFRLSTLDGKKMNLSDYKGKKVILNFWATWCPPCKAEMPHMQKFYAENKEEGVEIIAVNLTNMDHGIDGIHKFIKDYELTFTVPLDEDGQIGKQYQAITIPTSYVIDTEGVIAKKIVGPMDEGMMEGLIKGIE